MEPFFLNHFRQFGTSYLSRICCGLFLHNYVKNWATLYSNIWSRCYSPTWYCSRSKRKARIKVGCPKSNVFVCQAFESGKRQGVREREREREREIGVRYLLIGFAHKKLRWQFIAWTSAKYESGSASPWLASFIFSPTVSLDPSLFSHSLTCSVTRWLDYFSAFGHLYEQTFAQWHRKFAKVAPKFCQVVNKPLKICPSQTVEIFPNLITLHLW